MTKVDGDTASGGFDSKRRALGNAISRVEDIKRHAKISARIDKGSTCASAPGFDAAIWKTAARICKIAGKAGFSYVAKCLLLIRKIERLGSRRPRQKIPSNPQIVAFAVACIGVNNEPFAQWNIHRSAASKLVRSGRIARKGIDMHWLIRHRAGNALVDHIHCAANSRAAEQQHCRPPENLDPLRRQRINCHGMVCRCVRGVDVANTIGQHRNAIALETAQHGAGCAWRKTCRRNAGQLRQHITNLGARFICKDFAAHG